jgi:hypothetical protein
MTQTEGRGRPPTTRPGAPAPSPSQKPEAIRQRKRRADPAKRAREKLVEHLRQETLEQLAKNHSVEFITLYNEKRLANGLPTYYPGGAAHSATVRARARRDALAIAAYDAPAGQADLEVQKRCRHDQGLKKLPYGVFCAIETCGKRIR